MIIHFESGSCPSRITEGFLDRLVSSYEFSDQFMYTYDWSYFCPDCERGFPKLSALCQHVEDTPSCSYLLDFPHCFALLDMSLEESISRLNPVIKTYGAAPQHSIAMTGFAYVV